jgi:hypothetical protein
LALPLARLGAGPAKDRAHIFERVKRMAGENPPWGAPRIHGELLKLGFEISERTVSRYLLRCTPKNP